MASDPPSIYDDPTTYRRTTQQLMPHMRPRVDRGAYDLYPAHELASGMIAAGFSRLAAILVSHGSVVIDGSTGIDWEDFRRRLDRALAELDRRPCWVPVSDALRPAGEIQSMLAPFLGGDDPLWGTRFTGRLADYFDVERFPVQRDHHDARGTILYGTGSSLAGWGGYLVYVDLPRNELQFRARAGCATNLGVAEPLQPRVAYKRSYFADWPALNREKPTLLRRIDTFVDGQRADAPTMVSGEAVRRALKEMSRSAFRVRPWFEPGPWGGDYLKRTIPTLPQEAPNYAWSFELIAPENGLLLSSDDLLHELAFDWLMYAESDNVLGRAAARFAPEFPIRFDYLDTVNGGNLSVQCHPRTDYVREHFGESFTQDETYYMVHCEPGARVYLGFAADADAEAFRRELERSAGTGSRVDVDRFVNSEPASRGDLFLIPNGTIHCSGRGNLVLEISATPYIFTFKMYDWVRRDLDGNLRPLNIERAWRNLYFDRRGDRVRRELVAHPVSLASGPGWRIVHLPTHPEQFYDVVRYEFETAIDIDTHNDCHVMNLVEGNSLRVEIGSGATMRINAAETFVVPAAAGSYRLVNTGNVPVKVVRAWVK